MRTVILTASLILAVLASSVPAGAEGAQNVSAVGRVLFDSPDGKGDPGDIACRKAQQLPGSRLMGPPVCKSNREWAQIRKDGYDVSPDGRQIVQSEKSRTLNPVVCTGSSPPSTSNMFNHVSSATCPRY